MSDPRTPVRPVLCPRCRGPLASSRDLGVATHRCPACEGHAIGLDVMRRFARRADFGEVLMDLRREGGARTLPCPFCARPMEPVDLHRPGARLELDGCDVCRVVWMDPGEERAVRREDEPSAPARELPPEARRAWAAFLASSIREWADD